MSQDLNRFIVRFFIFANENIVKLELLLEVAMLSYISSLTVYTCMENHCNRTMSITFYIIIIYRSYKMINPQFYLLGLTISCFCWNFGKSFFGALLQPLLNADDYAGYSAGQILGRLSFI